MLSKSTQIVWDTIFPENKIDTEFVIMYLKIKRDIIREKVKRRGEK
jgi:hypothetical protein